MPVFIYRGASRRRPEVADLIMASVLPFCSVLLVSWMFTIIGKAPAASGIFQPSQWAPATATFYGDETASATTGGACGYGNLFANGYGTDTVALSSTLFNNGYACGACYQITCHQSNACYQKVPYITVTATNLCPPNWAQPSDNGGWCNPPRTHFNMSKPAFMKIADWHSGIVPVIVACVRSGGIRFALEGNGYWLLVYVMNVGGGGDIGNMWVRGSYTGWISMSHNWGTSYQAFASLAGQSLSFKLTSYTSHDTIIAWNVVPPNWTVGLTYSSNMNFY